MEKIIKNTKRNIVKKTRILLILIFMTTIYSYGQTVTIKNMKYKETQVAITDCGVIDFSPNINVDITFTVRVEVTNSSSFNGDGYIRILGKRYQSSTIGTEITSKHFFTTDWSLSGITRYIEKSFDIPLYGVEFNNDGGVIYAEYQDANFDEHPSCEFDVIRSPTFILNHPNLVIDCGDNSPVSFTATNLYNHPGSTSYQWTIGNGWLLSNGNISPSSITTSSNTLTLTPNSYPLENVSVVPILDGVNYPSLTSHITLPPIGNREIIGEITVCSSEILSISNLKANETVVWSSSNTSIASISTSNNQATVSANGSGIVTITATITNPCGQQVIKTKVVTVGTPAGYSDANIEPHPYSGNGGGFYLNNWTRMWMTNYPGGYNWHWTANYSMIQNASSAQPRIKPLSNGYMTVKVRRSNKCGYGAWVPKNFYITPKPGGGHHFEGF